MRRENRGKTKIKRIVFLMMLIIMISPVYVSAAGNYKDTWYYYEYPGDGGDFSTGSRAKWDYTSSYIKNLNNRIVLSVSVWSTEKEAPTNFILYRNCTAGRAFFDVNPGESKYLPNYIKEWGYKYCTLMITPGTHDPEVFSGLWSPDSI